MSNFKRKKPRPGPRDNWAHKPELDPEPDPSKTSAVNNHRKNKQKKVWVVTGKDSLRRLFKKKRPPRCVYSSFATEKQAIQSLEAMEKQDASWNKLLGDNKWPSRDYRIEYKGKDK